MPIYRLMALGALMLAAAPASAREAPLSEAQYSFGIREISQYRNTVSFLIPGDARAHQQKGDAVVLSAIYALDKPPSEPCPVVDSRAVSKDVKQYDPFTGKARVTATFKDAGIARRAAQNGCLLIYDEK